MEQIDSCKAVKTNSIVEGDSLELMQCLEDESIDLIITCYSDDTEILTKSGWKLFNELKREDQVATLDVGHNMHYIHPSEIQDHHYSGDMIKINHRSIDLLVTPNHNLYIRAHNSKRYKFVRADSPIHSWMLNQVNWEADDKEWFRLPPIELSKFNNGIIKDKLKMDDFLEFIGWYIAEGSTNKSGYIINITQTKEEGKKDIGDCITRLGYKWHYANDKDFRFANKQLYEYLKPLGKAHEKYIPDEFMHLSKRQLKILFDAYCKGDGYASGGKKGFATTSKRLADQLQEMIIKLGYNSTLRVRDRRYEEREYNGYVIKHSHLTYEINIRRSKECYLRKDKNFDTERYNGRVYCCSVPSHIILVRRNGRPAWCGNSPPYADRRKKTYEGAPADKYSEWFLPFSSEMKRVLKPSGSFALNIGDIAMNGEKHPYVYKLVLDLKDQGWKWIDTYIWTKCLSGDTNLFVDNDNVYRIMSIQDIYNKKDTSEFKIATQDKLGNEVWIKIKNVMRNGTRDLVKITTRSGRVIKCTSEHRFVTKRSRLKLQPAGKKRNFRQIKLKTASELTTKDYLYVNMHLHTDLPDGNEDDYEDGFIVGFYLAEGNWIYRDYKPFKNNPLSIASQKGVLARCGELKPRGRHRRGAQFSCGTSDIERGYIQVLEQYPININCYEKNNFVHITSYAEIFELVKTYVTGMTCDTKYLMDNAFNRSKNFIKGIIDGFLADGSHDEQNRRWRVQIKPNHKLKEQFELMCRIINYDFRLFATNKKVKNITTGKMHRAMDFSIRKPEGQHRLTQFDMFIDKIRSIEVIEAEDVFDIEVEVIYRGAGSNQHKKSYDQSKQSYNAIYNHLYFLSNGIWTHNSNPYPGKWKNRFKNGFEYIYHFAKTRDITWNPDSVRQPAKESTKKRVSKFYENDYHRTTSATGSGFGVTMTNFKDIETVLPSNVIHMANASTNTGHSAPFPEKLPEFFIKVFSNEGDVVLDPFMGSGTTAVAAKKNCRNFMGFEKEGKFAELSRGNLDKVQNIECGI